MKMGFSSSFTVSGAPNPGSSDSLNGLKFGHKIYIEDVGVGAPPAKSASGSSSSSSTAAAAAKKGKGVVREGQPPRCQVEGCKVDLSDAKSYYSRHKVCGMHSKSPMVIVTGLQQRFCQQCSRFHQLPEFDQGKRSCRRRLAGHNERRRKPPPGSLFSSRHGRFSSSVFENRGSDRGILVNFSAYTRPPGKNPWRNMRSSEWVSGNQTSSTGTYVAHSWQNGSENAPSNSKPIIQGSSAGTGCPSINIPSGECHTGVSNSDYALSLLSNQPWASRNRASCLRVNNVINNEGTCVIQPTVSQGVAVDQFLNTRCFGSRSSNDISPDRGLDQVSQPNNNSEFTGAVVLAQQSGMPYMELEHCRAYNSTQQMHWSL